MTMQHGLTSARAQLPTDTPLSCERLHFPPIQDRDGDDHHIFPLGMGGPDTVENLIRICPNEHRQTHALLNLYVRHEGLPPVIDRRRFSLTARYLAHRGWAEYQEAQREVQATRH